MKMEVKHYFDDGTETCSIWTGKDREDLPNIDYLDTTDILQTFREHGFNVTYAAVKHNFDAWKADLKSGYLDEKYGYFLFSPCGCNELSFDVQRLNGKDYQKTYTC